MSSLSSIATDEDIIDRWIEIDDSINVPEQTLDEILAEKFVNFGDDLSLVDDDFHSSVGTNRRTQSLLDFSYKLKSPITKTKLDSISHQLNSLHSRNCSGSASAIAVSRRSIVVGTNRGLILLFCRKTQRLEFSYTSNGCPVSCLTFNHSETKIIIGFGAGNLQIVSASSGKLLFSIDDAVQPGRGILQIIALCKSRHLIILDSGGSVYELRLPSTIRSSHNRCIFSGSNGEIIHMCLVTNDRFIVLFSVSKLYVITLPNIECLFVLPYYDPPTCPPLIDWQIVDIKLSANEEIAGLAICIARGSRIDVFRLAENNRRSSKIASRIRSFRLSFDLINLKWLDSYHMIAIDRFEKIHLIDLELGDVDVEAIAEIGLVYGSADFKGLATGGNVSMALQALADTVCYQSVYRLGKTLYVLGQQSVYAISLLDQISLLNALIDDGDLPSAVLYASDLYGGKVRNKSDNTNMRDLISAFIPSLVEKLLVYTLNGISVGRIVHLVDHYKKHIDLLMRICTVTSRFDLLYGAVYMHIEKDVISKSIFFEFFDDVFNDGSFGNPPPSLISDYLQYLVAEGHLNQFEAAVMRMPIEILNIHYAMSVCRANHLYDGIISIHNRAFSEYIGPLEEMFEAVEQFIDSDVLSDCEIIQGNKLLLYLQCCLSGQAYPFVSLTKDVASTLPSDIYRCLISYRGKNGSNASSTYPYLKLLIKFDAIQFFNVICTCSDSVVFREDDSRLQRLVEICYQIIAQSVSVELESHLLTFIIHLLKIRSIVAPIEIISDLIESILTNGSSKPRASDVERCIIDVLRIVNGLNESAILSLATSASFLQVCAYIYKSRRQYENLVQCYIKDEKNGFLVFSVIKSLLAELNQNERLEFLRYLRSIINTLASLDSVHTAELVLEFLMDWLTTEDMQCDDYSLIYNCFLLRRELGHHTLTGNEEIDEKHFFTAVSALLMRTKDEMKDKALLDLLKYWLPVSSRSDKCLNIAVSYNLTFSTIMLLEARQLIDRTFEFVFAELDKEWEKDDVKCSKYINELIRLSSCYHLQSQNGQWLTKLLLKILTLSEWKLSENRDFLSHLDHIITSIVESGSEDADLIIDTLFNHPSFRNSTYGRYSSLITHIFEVCCYKSILLAFTIKCIKQESNACVRDIVEASTSRCSELIISRKCVVCSEPPNKSSFIFRCGHLMHMHCETEIGDRRCPCQFAKCQSFGASATAVQPDFLLSLKPTGSLHPLNIFDEERMKLRLGPSQR